MSLKNGTPLFLKSTNPPLTATDAFPSSAAFDVINSTLQADEAERKDAISKAKAVVAFNLKNADGKEEAWHLDLKEKGVVGKGAAPAGGKADGASPSRIEPDNDILVK